MLFISGQKILDTIFPPRDSELLIRSTTTLHTEPELIHACAYPTQYISAYTNPQVHAAIIESKYHNNRKAHKLLGALLQTYIVQTNEHFDYIVPIPLSKQRLHERGHNQVVSSLTRANQRPLLALTRTNNESQTHLSRPERIANVHDAFSLNTTAKHIAGTHIILLDDVVTTGATLSAAARTLEQAKPASIRLLALAH